MIKNVIPNLHLWCSLYRDPRGVFGIFQETGMIEWGQNAKPQKIPDQKLTPQKFHADSRALTSLVVPYSQNYGTGIRPGPPPPPKKKKSFENSRNLKFGVPLLG